MAPQHRKTFTFRTIVQNLFQGVIVIAPVGVTVYVFWWLFSTVDNILPNILSHILPTVFNDGPQGIRRIPGLGFLVALVLLIVIGRLSSVFFISRLMEYFDRILEKTPGVKLIYTSVKDFLQAFAGNKKKFDKPVLVNVDGADIWRLGFVTQADAAQFGLADHVVVYVPHSYALSGITYMVPPAKIKFLDNQHIKSADAMKFAVSGGVTEMDHK